MTVSNKKVLATLDTVRKRTCLLASIIIIYRVLSSPAYVHLCKCLIKCEIKKEREKERKKERLKIASSLRIESGGSLL